MKTNLKVIKCTPKHERYLRAYIRTRTEKRKQIQDGDSSAIAQLVLYGVKYVAAYREFEDKSHMDRKEVEIHFALTNEILSYMEKLTYRQFVNLFPIEKRYDGEKYMSKDYYYIMEKLKEVDMDDQIGDGIHKLLWDYTNVQISWFMVSLYCTASDIQKKNGGKSIFEELTETFDLQTYTINEQEGYIIDNQTNEVMPYKKPKPDYLKLVK